MNNHIRINKKLFIQEYKYSDKKEFEDLYNKSK